MIPNCSSFIYCQYTPILTVQFPRQQSFFSRIIYRLNLASRLGLKETCRSPPWLYILYEITGWIQCILKSVPSRPYWIKSKGIPDDSSVGHLCVTNYHFFPGNFCKKFSCCNSSLFFKFTLRNICYLQADQNQRYQFSTMIKKLLERNCAKSFFFRNRTSNCGG
jgi:hypothetical protein